MSGMFWIAIGFNIMLSLKVKKLNAFKFDGVAEPDNTGFTPTGVILLAFYSRTHL